MSGVLRLFPPKAPEAHVIELELPQAVVGIPGIQPTTATSWWTKGYVSDNASLRLLTDALGVQLSDIVAAYERSRAARSWIFTDAELEAVLEQAAERGAERAVRQVLAALDAETR